MAKQRPKAEPALRMTRRLDRLWAQRLNRQQARRSMLKTPLPFRTLHASGPSAATFSKSAASESSCGMHMRRASKIISDQSCQSATQWQARAMPWVALARGG
jgi:hypothetical protein